MVERTGLGAAGGDGRGRGGPQGEAGDGLGYTGPVHPGAGASAQRVRARAAQKDGSKAEPGPRAGVGDHVHTWGGSPRFWFPS